MNSNSELLHRRLKTKFSKLGKLVLHFYSVSFFFQFLAINESIIPIRVEYESNVNNPYIKNTSWISSNISVPINIKIHRN